MWEIFEKTNMMSNLHLKRQAAWNHSKQGKTSPMQGQLLDIKEHAGQQPYGPSKTAHKLTDAGLHDLYIGI